MGRTHIVIMAGGIGSRLYPLSTPERPKQFLDLLGVGKTLIQLTYERFLRLDPEATFWFVTSEKYIHFIKEQLPEVPDEQILAEPEARSTAPCIAYACWKIKKRDPQATVVVAPSDAYVPDLDAFAATLKQAVDFASSTPSVVCVGIKPTFPHTGYGYIHAAAGDGVVKVSEFKEKPSLEVAERYLSEGGYTWNAGIFVWSASTIESELRAYSPQICGVMDRLAPSLYTEGERAALKELFPQCDRISIDYAVMEKSDKVYAIVADWEWSDLGSFESIEKITGRSVRPQNE